MTLEKTKSMVTAIVFTLLASIPFLLINFLDSMWTIRVERFMILLLLGAATFRATLKKKEKSRSEELHILWAILPAIPGVVYMFIYSVQSYNTLLLGDQDFTNISSAISSPQGVLTTYYVDTGSVSSYLAHHFALILVLFVPVFKLLALLGFTHKVYAILLAVVFLMGALSSILLARSIAGSNVATAVALLFSISVPILRIASSFHFEVLTIPVFALCFWFWHKENRLGFLLMFLMGLFIKEDMAAYLAGFSFWLGWLGKNSFDKRIGRQTFVIAVLYFAVVNLGTRLVFDGPDWLTYTSSYEQTLANKLSALWELLLAFGLTILFAPRFYFVALIPGLVLHLLSNHPWHSTYYGHYSYGLVPLLILGFILCAARFEEKRWVLLLAISVVLFRTSMDQQSPPKLPNSQPTIMIEPFTKVLQKDPSKKVCVQAAIHLSAQAPLSVTLLPLRLPKHAPIYKVWPSIDSENHQSWTNILMHSNHIQCDSFYLWFSSEEARDPYYSKEDLQDLKTSVDESFQLVLEHEGTYLFRHAP